MKIQKAIYLTAAALCAMPFIGTPEALLIGLILALTVANPYRETVKTLTHVLLQASVVGLGFGMNMMQAATAGKQGIWFTIFSIFSTLIIGFLAGRLLKVDKNTSFLISSGTAICGGSAIAALSGVIEANEKQISTGLGTIFILNSVALFIFPWLGGLLHLSQHQFGVWAAIAIHDTSSVAGAANKYGVQALQTAVTIKLERALWIIPVSLLAALWFKKKSGKIKIPYFIFLFVAAMLLNTFVPAIHPVSHFVVIAATVGLKITLFLIGTRLTAELIRSVGVRPLIQGVALWFFISVISLASVMYLVK
ncbi:MAG: putative sulfate exporter family transporter [Bacteroidia bacterium]|jgi:uncharacterized integral membrane protein (TIGR00698 family)|nr:putative sulfate exporter family transporter [Bacteroidia bacterium]